MSCPNYWQPCKEAKVKKVGNKQTCITQVHFVGVPSMECRSEGVVTQKCCSQFEEVSQSEVADLEDESLEEGEKSEPTKKLEAKLAKACSRSERQVLSLIKAS